MQITSLVLALFPGLFVVVHGAASLDEEIAAIRETYSGVGLTGWSVAGNQSLCSIGESGERIKNSGEPFLVTGDSRHHIGSDTKSMTAVLLAILIDDGTIQGGWESPLKTVLPDLAVSTSYEDVTLRELTGMLSGIPANPPSWWVYDDIQGGVRAQRAAAAEDALQSTPQRTPGAGYLYSNWGFVVAGHVIEEVTGETWEEVLVTRLFQPLGIELNAADVSSFTGPPNSDVDPWGHRGDDQIACDPSIGFIPGIGACDNPAVMGPAGTFSGPVAAMAAYFAWHVRCHNGQDNDLLLSQDACQEIHQPANAVVGTYGYGLHCTDQSWANGVACTHTGSNNFHYYLFWLGFGIDRAIVGYTNGGGRSDSSLDRTMVTQAFWAAQSGPQDCQDRIPSSYYTTTATPSSVPTSAPTNVETSGPTDEQSQSSTCHLCSNKNDSPERTDVGGTYAGEVVTIGGQVYSDCELMDTNAKDGTFSDEDCEELAASAAAFLCECPEADPPEGYGNCQLCPDDTLVVLNNYVNELEEWCWWGELEAPLYNDSQCNDFILDYVNTCCKPIGSVPFTAAALDYTDFADTNEYNKGNCGFGSVDAQYTSDATCKTRGSECNIGWTDPDEWVEYTFTSTSPEVDITLRASSGASSDKIFKMQVGATFTQEFNVPNDGWQKFNDFVVEGVPVVGDGKTPEVVRVTFLTGRVNLCAISVKASGVVEPPPTEGQFQVPFIAPAHDYMDSYGQIDSQSAGDAICYYRNAGSSIAFTEEGEWVAYAFKSAFDYVDITARVASYRADKMFSIGVGEGEGGESNLKTFAGPGEGWREYRDVTWKNVALNPNINDSMKVTFETGLMNLCSVSVVEAGKGGGGPEFAIPSTVTALDYAGYKKQDSSIYGNCNDELVSAQHTSDSVCKSRGASCNVGWTDAGDYLDYEFLTSLDKMDVTVRVASHDSNRKVTIKVYQVGGSKSTQKTFNSPGLGFQEFRDLVWEDVDVTLYRHSAVRVMFDDGKVNLCSVGVQAA